MEFDDLFGVVVGFICVTFSVTSLFWSPAIHESDIQLAIEACAPTSQLKYFEVESGTYYMEVTCKDGRRITLARKHNLE